MEHQEACRRLAAISLFATLSADEIARFARGVSWTSVNAGKTVINQLSKGGPVHFVSEGVFVVQAVAPTGRLVALRTLRPGDHFGELSALAGGHRSASVIAQTKGLLGECSAAQFLDLLRANAKFAEAVTVYLGRLAVQLSDRLLELAALKLPQRLCAELRRLADKGETTSEGILIKPAPSHERLAASVGAEREAVTRALRALAADGLIRSGRRQVLVLDPARLRAKAEQDLGLTATALVDWSV